MQEFRTACMTEMYVTVVGLVTLPLNRRMNFNGHLANRSDVGRIRQNRKKKKKISNLFAHFYICWSEIWLSDKTFSRSCLPIYLDKKITFFLFTFCNRI